MFRIGKIASPNVFLCLCALGIASAQTSTAPRELTPDDYARAEKFMGYNTTRLVFGTVRPSWLKDDRFWFRDATAEGNKFVVVDAATGKRSALFEHSKLAAALS